MNTPPTPGPVELHAVALIANGARQHADECDHDCDPGDLASGQHRAGVQLALRLADAIERDPAAVLALLQPEQPAEPCR